MPQTWWGDTPGMMNPLFCSIPEQAELETTLRIASLFLPIHQLRQSRLGREALSIFK